MFYQESYIKVGNVHSFPGPAALSGTVGIYIKFTNIVIIVIIMTQCGDYSFTENLAFGKPTYQYSGTYKDGKSSKAVDGNSNTHFQYGKPEGSCTMAVRTNNPWWRVDLQQVEHVSEVYIVNRGSDCGCPDRFKNFEIRVGMLFTVNKASLCDINNKQFK